MNGADERVLSDLVGTAKPEAIDRLVVASSPRAGQGSSPPRGPPEGGGAPGQPDSLTREAQGVAVRKLLDLISWLRRGLEKLHRTVGSDYTRLALHSLIRACDPGTNPRLRGALQALGLGLQWTQRTWTLGRIPRSANRVLRAHWGARTHDKKSWIRYVLAACGRPPRRVEEKIRLEVTVHRKKLQDPDNAVASVKPLLDALRRTGWLRDDSHEWLELSVKEVLEKNKRRQRTEITWRPAGSEVSPASSSSPLGVVEAPNQAEKTPGGRGGEVETTAPAFSPGSGTEESS